MRGNPSVYARAGAIKIQQIRHAPHKEDRCGWYLVRSSIAPFICGLSSVLLTGPSTLPVCRRSAGSHSSRATDYIVKSGREKKRSQREKEITLRIASYYCREQSRTFEGGKGHLMLTSSSQHRCTCNANERRTLICTYLR